MIIWGTSGSYIGLQKGISGSNRFLLLDIHAHVTLCTNSYKCSTFVDIIPAKESTKAPGKWEITFETQTTSNQDHE